MYRSLRAQRLSEGTVFRLQYLKAHHANRMHACAVGNIYLTKKQHFFYLNTRRLCPPFVKHAFSLKSVATFRIKCVAARVCQLAVNAKLLETTFVKNKVTREFL
jgi:hypothetical protein